MLEHGAYTLLLDAYYDREHPPTKQEAIEWSWARTPEEIAAVEFILVRFFHQDGEVYRQKRADEEIIKYKEKSQTNKRIAQEREHKKKQERERTVNEPYTDGHLTNNQEPITNNQKLKEEKTCPAGAEHSTPHSDTSQQDAHKQRKKQPVTSGEDVSAVFIHWKAVMGHDRAKLDAKREKAIKARLKDGYTVLELCEAVDGCKASPFHQGDNKDRTKYDDIELVCREAKNVDKFRRIKADGFTGKGLSQAGARTAAAAERFLARRRAAK